MDVRNKRCLFHTHEIRVETYKASGPGGQHRNKTETAVRVRHLPSGITAIAAEHRSQARNKELALRRLTLKLQVLRQKRTPRIPTSIPRSYIEKVLSAKRHKSRIKRLRQKIRHDEL
jgi:protein subunit release factor B